MKYFSAQERNKFEQRFESQLSNKVIIEYKKYRPFDFNSFQFKEQSYGACLFSQIDKSNSCIKLGDAITIEKLLFQGDIKNKLLSLYEILISNFDKNIASVDEITISPDGALNLLSFSSLLNNKGQYLIETYLVHYVLAGRHISQRKRVVKVKTYDYLGIGGIYYGKGKRYKELPMSHTEIKEVNNYFKADEKKTNILVKSHAEKSVVSKSLESAKFYSYCNSCFLQLCKKPFCNKLFLFSPNSFIQFKCRWGQVY